MIAIVRNLRIPCRYVSGYLHRDPGDSDRSDEGATHAWVEALLPRIGWVGFDPTNNLIVGGRHIRTAIGRDYADVSPTVGTMKGSAETELQVRVRVTPSDAAAASRQGVCRGRGMVPFSARTTSRPRSCRRSSSSSNNSRLPQPDPWPFTLRFTIRPATGTTGGYRSDLK